MAVLSDRLKGKVALITGAGAGIGKGCALMFARHGAQVMATDIDANSVQATVDEAKSEGLIMESVHPIDLTNEAQVQRLVDATVQHYGRIDSLVNAGAWGAFKWIEEMDYVKDWKKTLECELDVVFLACKAAWPHLKKQGGTIVNFASANAWVALEGSPALAHCAGKGGVLAMTRQLAMEGGPFGIRANSICPGMIVTAATTPVLKQPGFLDNVLKKKMIKRVGQPEDIGWLATFLASDESTWITATDISCDGGATSW
ncbi:MAG: SDR family NAD(P)-dependent oxidoreductase [Steroidobacteraceae bacterium]